MPKRLCSPLAVLLATLLSMLCAPVCAAQAPSGAVSVRLVQPVDTATLRLGRAVPGTVLASSDGSVPLGSGAAVQLVQDAGGFTLQLARLGVNGQMFGVTSSAPVLADGSPVGGAALLLPAGTVVRFTIAQAVARGPARVLPLRPAGETPALAAARHPANTIRDIPAAAPGYPPLHATYDAQEGCWWKPFLSRKWGFEAAVQQCESTSSTFNVVDSGQGLAFVSNGAAPENFLRVLHKPAAQSIETTIHDQFIVRLKLPAARASCAVKRDPNSGGRNAEVYRVEATGPYSRQKRFHEMDAEDACPGIQSTDAVDVRFLYLPSAMPTMFFELSTLDYGNAFDEASMQFATPPQ